MTEKKISSVFLSNTEKGIHDVLINGLRWINWKDIIRSDSKVFIKPNFTWPKYKPGVVTSPSLLRSLLPILKNRCSQVILGESDLPGFNSEEAFSNLGIYKICRKFGIRVVNLSKEDSIFLRVRVQNREIKVELPRFLVNDVDVFVSVPVMKTHSISGVSLSLKNQWGCIPDQKRGMLYHTQLNQMIVAINKILKPKIIVTDGLYALDGRGPIFGNPKKMDLVVVSDNPVVADATCCEIMKMSANKVGHIVLANREGLGEICLKHVKINQDLGIFAKQFKVQKVLFDYLLSFTFKSQTVSNLVFSSCLTPLIYRLADPFRPSKERFFMNNDIPAYLNHRKSFSL